MASRTERVTLTTHEQLIRDIIHTLNHPDISDDQQRLLCAVMTIAMQLRDAAQCSARNQLIQRVTSRRPTHPVFGPQRRPLSEAATRQNAQARARREYISALAEDGLKFSPKRSDSARPIRYGDAFNDLLGPQSIPEEHIASFAETWGNDTVIRLAIGRHTYHGPWARNGHAYVTTGNRHLIEVRQARALAGLSAADID